MTDKTELQKAYLLMQANCGIDVGDMVKVLRQPQSQENGWNKNTLKSDEAAANIGKSFTVSRVTKDSIILDVDGVNWCYPFFVLEKIPKPSKLPEKILGMKSAYKEALGMRGENMLIAGTLVVELVERIRELEGASTKTTKPHWRDTVSEENPVLCWVADYEEKPSEENYNPVYIITGYKYGGGYPYQSRNNTHKHAKRVPREMIEKLLAGYAETSEEE